MKLTGSVYRAHNPQWALAPKDLATRRIKPPSREMTERLAAAGVAGIIVPSFASFAGAADVNVVFWQWSVGPLHQVRVVGDEHRLPRDASSWG